MKTQNNFKHLYRIVAVIACANIFIFAHGQKILNSPITGNLTVTDPTSIVLASGFSSNGFTFNALIVQGKTYQLSLDAGKNYILTVTAKEASTSPNVNISNEGPRQTSQLTDQIVYFDGMGRPVQSVSINSSPSFKDIVQPLAYDNFGREKYKYLPYPLGINDNNGAFVSTALADQKNYYESVYGVDNPAYSNTVYEFSALNRILEQGAPGIAWQPAESNLSGSGHTLRYEYSTNTQYDVLILRVNSSGNCVNSGGENNNGKNYYNAGELYKTITKDENWSSGQLHTVEEYKDKNGNVVLKRGFVENPTDKSIVKVETYYVYDDRNLLRYVISPKALSAITFPVDYTNSIVKSLCYYYEYDTQDRMKSKQLPGADMVYMVYDVRDRLVLTQDGKQRNHKNSSGQAAPQWTFTKYDCFNRPVMTGIKEINDKTFAQLQSEILTYNTDSKLSESAVTTGNVGYTLTQSYPSVSESELLTLTYYDNYDFPGKQSFTNILEYTSFNNAVKGQVTGGKERIIGNTATWLTTTQYYDEKYRKIQFIKAHHLQGTERVTNLYSFDGKVSQSLYEYTASGKDNVSIAKRMEYDNSQRLSRIYHKINNEKEILMSYMIYDELGQLADKKIHSSDDAHVKYLQSIDYRYNIRGWLKNINNSTLGTLPTQDDAANEQLDVFGMEIHYND